MPLRLEVFLGDRPKDERSRITTKVSDEIQFDEVTLYTPNYQRMLWQNVDFVLPKGESLLVVGKSGCGKSSLFRAIARYNREYYLLFHYIYYLFRLWDSGSGKISAPEPKDVFILPQHPYAPLGSLRHLLLYPHFQGILSFPVFACLSFLHTETTSDNNILEVMEKANLTSLLSIAGGLDGTGMLLIATYRKPLSTFDTSGMGSSAITRRNAAS